MNWFTPTYTLKRVNFKGAFIITSISLYSSSCKPWLDTQEDAFLAHYFMLNLIFTHVAKTIGTSLLIAPNFRFTIPTWMNWIYVHLIWTYCSDLLQFLFLNKSVYPKYYINDNKYYSQIQSRCFIFKFYHIQFVHVLKIWVSGCQDVHIFVIPPWKCNFYVNPQAFQYPLFSCVLNNHSATIKTIH